MTTTHNIWKQFHSLNENRDKIIAYLREIPEEKLRASPLKGWSMIQAVRHLQVSESTSVAYMNKKKLGGDDLKETGFKSRFALTIVDVAFKSGLKFKAPSVLKEPIDSSLDELVSDWDLTRKQIEEFLEEYPDKWENKAVYRHPFAGMLTVYDAIRFFNIHQNQHKRQVLRIAKHFM